MNEGRSRDIKVEYTVTDADGLIDTATLTITVIGKGTAGTSLDLDLNVATQKAQLEENDPGRTDVKVGTDAVAYFTGGNDIVGFRFNAKGYDGTQWSDQMVSDDAGHTFNGGAGDDILTGNGGIDTINGDDGNDRINGGLDNDFIDGGAGNDVINGNEGNDVISGGSGFNVIHGDVEDVISGGDDIITGGDDIDQLYGDAGNDQLTGGAGNDLLAGGFGNDVLNGGDGNDIINGDDGFNYPGTTSNDVINGGAGNDTLKGGIGDDTFIFDSALTNVALGTTNVDTIIGFSPNASGNNDVIHLDNSVFTAFASAGALSAAAFKQNTTGLMDADDRIIYNSSTGALSYDADGNGAGSAAVQFALLDKGLSLTNADFLVI